MLKKKFSYTVIHETLQKLEYCMFQYPLVSQISLHQQFDEPNPKLVLKYVTQIRLSWFFFLRQAVIQKDLIKQGLKNKERNPNPFKRQKK